MSAIALRWLVGLALLAGVAAAGYWAGDHHRNNAWLAKQALAERAAHDKYQAEVKRGETNAGALIDEKQAMQAAFETLKEKFDELRKRTPLVVRRGGAVCAGSGGQAGTAHAAVGTVLDGDGAVLSAGAVWVWNSALAGTDQPAGACGAADLAAPACAAATGLTVEDAWANHTLNAQRCAEDRLAHQHLIDHLKAKP